MNYNRRLLYFFKRPNFFFTSQATARQRSRSDECATFDGGINMCSYDGHEALYSRLDSLAKRNPQLAQVGSVGKSREGRDLFFIKISSNVNKRSLMEPMFKVPLRIKLQF